MREKYIPITSRALFILIISLLIFTSFVSASIREEYGVTEEESQEVFQTARFVYQDYLDNPDDPQYIAQLSEYSYNQIYMAAELAGGEDAPLNDGTLFVDLAEYYQRQSLTAAPDYQVDPSQANTLQEREVAAQRAQELQDYVYTEWEPEPEEGLFGFLRQSSWERAGMERDEYILYVRGQVQEDAQRTTQLYQESYVTSLEEQAGTVPADGSYNTAPLEEKITRMQSLIAQEEQQIQELKDEYGEELPEDYSEEGTLLSQRRTLQRGLGITDTTTAPTGLSDVGSDTSGTIPPDSQPTTPSDPPSTTGQESTVDLINYDTIRQNQDDLYYSSSWQDHGVDYFEASGIISEEKAQELRDDDLSGSEIYGEIDRYLREERGTTMDDVLTTLAQNNLYLYDASGERDKTNHGQIIQSLSTQEETVSEEPDQQSEEPDGLSSIETQPKRTDQTEPDNQQPAEESQMIDPEQSGPTPIDYSALNEQQGDETYYSTSWREHGIDYFEASGILTEEIAQELRDSDLTDGQIYQEIDAYLQSERDTTLGEVLDELAGNDLYVYDQTGEQDKTNHGEVIQRIADGETEEPEEEREQQTPTDDKEDPQQIDVESINPNEPSITEKELGGAQELGIITESVNQNPRDIFGNAPIVTVVSENGEEETRYVWDAEGEEYVNAQDGDDTLSGLETNVNYYHTNPLNRNQFVTRFNTETSSSTNRVLDLTGGRSAVERRERSDELQYIRSGTILSQGQDTDAFSQGDYIAIVTGDQVRVVSKRDYDENGDEAENLDISNEEVSRAFEVAYTDIGYQPVTLNSITEEGDASTPDEARYVVDPEDNSRLFVISESGVEVRSGTDEETQSLIAQTLYTQSERGHCVSGCGQIRSRDSDDIEGITDDDSIRYITRPDGTREYIVHNQETGEYNVLDNTPGERNALLQTMAAAQDTITQDGTEYVVVDDTVYSVSETEDGETTFSEENDQTTERVLAAAQEERQETLQAQQVESNELLGVIQMKRDLFNEHRNDFLTGLGDKWSSYLHGYGREAADNFVRQACYDMMFAPDATGEMQLGSLFGGGLGAGFSDWSALSAPFSGGCQLLPTNNQDIQTQSQQNQEQYQEDLEYCQEQAQGEYEAAIEACGSVNAESCIDSARTTYYEAIQSCQEDTAVANVGEDSDFGSVAARTIPGVSQFTNLFSGQQLSCRPTNGMSSEELDTTVFPGTTTVSHVGRKYNDASALDDPTCSYVVSVKLSSLYPVRLAMTLQNNSLESSDKDNYLYLSNAIGLYDEQFDPTTLSAYPGMLDSASTIRSQLGTTANMSNYLMKHFYKLQPDPELSTNSLDAGNMSIYAHKYIESNAPCNFNYVCYYVMGANIDMDPPYLCKRLSGAS